MGFDLLTLGAQGVLTAQRQLNTTGHNIANVNTEGYSRQSVEQRTNDSLYWNGNRWGAGVRAAAVRRDFDKFAVNELNLTSTALAYAQTRNRQIGTLSELMSNSGQKIPENMNEFFRSLQAVADSPNDLGARQVVLEKLKLVSSSFSDIDGILQQQQNDLNVEIDISLERVNEIGQELISIHQAILKRNGVDNDLLDRHQQLINELSTFTRVTVNQRNDGTFNILIGTGQTLVSGVNASKLTTVPGSPDYSKKRLAIVEGNSSKVISTDDLQGKLGALFEQRDGNMLQLRDELGQMAIGFSDALNKVQESGYDLYGNKGQGFFGNINSEQAAANRVYQSPESTAELKVYIEDIAKLKLGDYKLKRNGTTYTLLDPSKKEYQFNIASTPPTNIVIDGFKIQIDKKLAENEQVIIRPLRGAASEMKLKINDPGLIAAQNYITSGSEINGKGNLNIIAFGNTKEFTVEIIDGAKKFAIYDNQGRQLTAAQNYPPATVVDVNGTQFELTSGAVDGDKFVVSLVAADGDSSNIQNMLGLQTKKIMNNGRSTVLDLYEELNTNLGLQSSSYEQMEQVNEAEYDAAQGRVASISGVNLDEEAANLLKFQQAYMASSRILTAANEAFETLLNATR